MRLVLSLTLMTVLASLVLGCAPEGATMVPVLF